MQLNILDLSYQSISEESFPTRLSTLVNFNHLIRFSFTFYTIISILIRMERRHKEVTHEKILIVEDDVDIMEAF